MKKQILSICSTMLLLVLPMINYAQYPNLEWVKHWGSPQLDAGMSVAVDSEGNVYTAGHFKETVDFDPGAGVFEMTATGDREVFISKLDANGNFLWANHLKGYAINPIISVDQSGDIYISCYFGHDSITLSSASTSFTLSSFGVYDVLVAKLDADGDFLWAKQFGSDYSYTTNGAFSLDANGFVYITGTFDDVVDFDPGVNTFNMTPTDYGTDAFICKLDNNGNFIWAKQFGRMDSSSGYASGSITSIAVDTTGNVYTTGVFFTTTDFNPGADVYNLTSNGSLDIFVSKLDSNGDFVWAKQIGGTADDWSGSILTDGQNNLYITGSFKGTVDFDPGVGTSNMTTINQAGNDDVFFLKLDSNGNFIWAKQIGISNAVDNSTGIYGTSALDTYGNIYTMGPFSGTADFNPSNTDVFEMTSSPSPIIDLYFLKLDLNGNFIWATQFGSQYSSFSAEAGDFTIDNTGNIHITGSFAGTVDFDPENTVYNLTSADYDSSYHSPYYDAFILKLGQTGIIGVEEVSSANKVSVFPNPNNGIFVVSAENLFGSTNIKVYTVSGQLILSTTDLKKGMNMIDISSQPNGVYFIEIKTNSETVFQRVIKNN